MSDQCQTVLRQTDSSPRSVSSCGSPRSRVVRAARARVRPCVRSEGPRLALEAPRARAPC
eukprot:scaffold88685_cov64-Phaeocystis_antarctica.AAC.4